jgi:hypothetical protein
MLQPGRFSTLTWFQLGEQTGSITLPAQSVGVRLIYRAKDRDGALIDVNELVTFVYTPTRFDGRRQWLRCLRCGRRCRKIYGVSDAGGAIGCDTPRRAKGRVSAPWTGLARSPSACMTGGEAPPSRGLALDYRAVSASHRSGHRRTARLAKTKSTPSTGEGWAAAFMRRPGSLGALRPSRPLGR